MAVGVHVRALRRAGLSSVGAERELSQRTVHCEGDTVDRLAGRRADLRQGQVSVHEAAFAKHPGGDAKISEALGVCDRLVSQAVEAGDRPCSQT